VHVDHALIVGFDERQTAPVRGERGWAHNQRVASVSTPRGVPELLRPLFPSLITGLTEVGRLGHQRNGDWWADENGKISRELRQGLRIEV
jgi:hypothetical protein